MPHFLKIMDSCKAAYTNYQVHDVLHIYNTSRVHWGGGGGGGGGGVIESLLPPLRDTQELICT